MTRVILDLEWNGAYSKRCNGYFNEIIEIGAVRLSDNGNIADRFDAYIRPVVSRKLTKLVTDLTGITDEQVETGITFEQAMARLRRFVGDGEIVLMTWSTTDLLVLMENCRYFFGDGHIPFFTAYVDLQSYAQNRLQVGGGQQVSLSKFAQLLLLDSEDMELHHAIDDSVLSAKIFAKVYEEHSFAAALSPVDEEFYRRVTFRTTYISDINSPLIRRADLRFSCNACGRNLKRIGNWKYYNRMFWAPFRCEVCDLAFTGRVQAKRKYEGVEIKKRLVRKKPKEAGDPTSETVTEN
jgi:DNA polymerase III epsilon subunit-like protein